MTLVSGLWWQISAGWGRGMPPLKLGASPSNPCAPGQTRGMPPLRLGASPSNPFAPGLQVGVNCTDAVLVTAESFPQHPVEFLTLGIVQSSQGSAGWPSTIASHITGRLQSRDSKASRSTQKSIQWNQLLLKAPSLNNPSGVGRQVQQLSTEFRNHVGQGQNAPVSPGS